MKSQHKQSLELLQQKRQKLGFQDAEGRPEKCMADTRKAGNGQWGTKGDRVQPRGAEAEPGMVSLG